VTRGVRWIGWSPGDGAGDATLSYVAALDELGVPVTWTPLTWPNGALRPEVAEGYDGPLAHLTGRAVEHDVVVFHSAPEFGRRWLGEAEGRRTVCVTTWETDRVPEGCVHELGRFDAVVVPSTFNRDALISAGCSTPAHVVPHVARRPRPVEPARFERIGDRFVFYVIATWSTRKAMAETVHAFLDAFESSEDVALVVKTGAHDQQAVARARRGEEADTRVWPTFASLLAGRRRVPEMHLISKQVPAEEIDALHARGNCFLSLTRSEGWGLCIADAIRFGNPVLVTGWGGQLDYLGEDYPLLVDYDLMPADCDPADDWFDARPGSRWARARHEHAVELLRWVAEHRDEAVAATAPVCERLARECAPEVIGRRLLAAL
jgi:hypothetical protein